MRRILHLSDIHFGPRHSPEVSAAVLDLVSQRGPDLVVISGDLTQRAKPHQFEQARRFVDQLQAPVLAVPGNHDVPMYRVWERVFSPYGAYRAHYDAELEPSYEDAELCVVGVNTAHGWTVKDGRMTREGLQRMASRLAAAPAGVARIVVAHHQLAPPPRFETQRVLTRASEMAYLLAEHDVDMVLSGHLHQTYITSTEAYYPQGRRAVLLVHTGTSTSSRGRGCERGRNTCNWIEIDDRQIRISPLIWRPGSGDFARLGEHCYPRAAAGHEIATLDESSDRSVLQPATASEGGDS